MGSGGIMSGPDAAFALRKISRAATRRVAENVFAFAERLWPSSE